MWGALAGLWWGWGGAQVGVGSVTELPGRKESRMKAQSQITIKGEIVKEPKILLQELFLFS